MGDIGAATDPDVNSQHWNPAKYPFCISRSGISLNYTPWLRQLVSDIDLAYVAGYYRIGDYSAISGSVRYFSLDEVFADDGMSVKPYEMALDVAYSMMLSEKFSLAAAIRWIHSDLRYDYSEDSKPASAFAADLAMYYNNYIMLGSRECQLGLGMDISNIGSKISFYGDDESQFLPANLRLGASLMVPVDEYNRFTITADANKFLVPTVPRQEEGESNSDYQDRVRRRRPRWLQGGDGRDCLEHRCRVCLPRSVLPSCWLSPSGGVKRQYEIFHRWWWLPYECLLSRRGLCHLHGQEQSARPDPPFHPRLRYGRN